MSDYNFYTIEVDCERSGSLAGAYIAKPDDMESLKGKRFYADDVLGKHSEISFRWGKNEYLPKITVGDGWKVIDLNILANELNKKDGEKFILVGGFPFMDHIEEYDDE